MILDKSIPTSRVSAQGPCLENLQQALGLGLFGWLELLLRLALRLWLRLARKAEGESEDNWGRCRGWQREGESAGSGSVEADGVRGS